MKNRRPLEILEYLSLFGAGMGSVASVMFQQVIYASAPLSFSVLLNLILRNRLDQEMSRRLSPMVDRLDRQTAEEEKALNAIRQKISVLPTPEDLAKTRETILLEAKQAISASEDRFKKQIAPLETIKLAPIEQELEKLSDAYAKLKASLATVNDRMGNAAPASRVQHVEEALAQLVAATDDLRGDVRKLNSRPPQDLAPLQQQLRSLREEFNLLPLPPDVRGLEQELAILRQEVEQLLRASGSMVSRQDLSTIYSELEKLHQRHKGLSQSISPMREHITSLQDQLGTISALSSQLATLQQQITDLTAQFQARPEEAPSSLPSSLEALQQQVTDLTAQFQARPEIKAIEGLKRALLKLSQGCEQLQQRIVQLTSAAGLQPLDSDLQDLVITQTLPLQQQLTSLQESVSLLQSEVFQLCEQQEALSNRQLELEDQQQTTLIQPSDGDDSFFSVQLELLTNRIHDLESQIGELQTTQPQPQAFTWIDIDSTNGRLVSDRQDNNHGIIETVPGLTVQPLEDTGWTPGNFRQVLNDLVTKSVESDETFADLSDRQITLLITLEQTQERLVIAGNWLGQRYLDGRILRKFQDLMNRGVGIDLDCHSLLEVSQIRLPGRINQQGNLAKLKNSSVQILRDLQDLQQAYPNHFRLRALGLRDEFLVCDRNFAVLTQTAQSTLKFAEETNLPDSPETLSQLAHELLEDFGSADLDNVDHRDSGEESPIQPIAALAEFCTTDAMVIESLIQQFDDPSPLLETVADYFHRAAIHYELGDKEAAIQDYNRILDINPDDAIAYNNRGLIYYELDALQQSFADFNQALAIDANNATVYANRGAVKADMEEWQGAIADYSEAIRIKPNDEIAYFNRGAARSNLGDYRGAIEDYSEAIRLNPYFANAHNNRGFAYQKLSNQQAAIADFDQALRINPNFANAYNNRGITRSKLGDFEGAIADFDQVIRINPDFANAYNNRGTVQSKLSDFKSALADFNQAIQINPTFANAYSNRGLAYADMGNLNSAREDLTKAAQLLEQQGDKFASEQTLQKLKALSQQPHQVSA